jgi:hypothetical protein
LLRGYRAQGKAARHLGMAMEAASTRVSYSRRVRETRDEGRLMILLVTASSRAKECAAALEQGTGHKTHVASSVPQAVSKMQTAEYEGLAIDQSLLESDFRALDTLLNHCVTAVPLYINLALHSTDRVVREVLVALRRSEKEKLLATRSAEQVLRNQLRSEITGILLNSELALRQQSISADVAEKIKSVRDLAEKMRSQLRIA